MAEMRDFENWDPMSNDYVDESFNTYVEGPGAMLEHNMQPWARANRSKGPFKIHVSNILPGITQEGLINIFCQFGEVVSCFKHDHLHWALIEFRKHGEAVAAINELNMRPPLFMKVQFARSESERQRLRAEREKVAVWKTVSESLVKSESLETPPRRKSGIGRGKLREVYVKGQFAPPVLNGSVTGAYLSDEDTVGPSLGGRFNEVNEALLKDIHYSLQSGSSNRIVSKGRGYYNVSPARPGSRRKSHVYPSDLACNSSEDSDIADLQDINRRTSGRYVYGDPVHLKPEVCGRCQNCGKVAHSGCARCGDFYCSENCLKIDWPLHKHNCIPAPGIVDISALNRSLGNRTMSESSPAAVQKDEGNLISNEMSKHATENISENVTVNKHISTPKGATKTSAAVTDDSKVNVIEPLVRDLKLGESQLRNEEISHKKIPPLLNFNHNSKGNTSPDKIGINYNQSETNVLPNQMNTNHSNDNKQSSRDERVHTSTNADTSKIYNDQRSRSRNSYGHNEANKRSSGPNQIQTEFSRRSYGPNEGNKRNYGQNEGNERIGQNEGYRRKNDSRHAQYDGKNKNNEGNRSQNDGSKRNYDGSQGKSDGNWGKNDGHRRSNDGNRRSNDGNRRNKSLNRNSAQRPSNQRTDREVDLQSGEQETNFENNSPLSKESKTVTKQQVECHKPAEKQSAATNVTKTEHNIPVIEKEELKEDCFTKVKVALMVGKNEYIVQKVETYMQLLENIQLIQGCEDSEVIDPQVGKICPAPYEGVWYRAAIKSLSPEIKVYFLDFGNEEICTSQSLRCIPDTSLRLPSQAIRIKFADGTHEKYENLEPDSELSVKPIKKDNCGATVVVPEGEEYPIPEKKPIPQCVGEQPHSKELPVDKAITSKTLCSDECVLALLKNGTEGAMCLQAVENINQFTGTVIAVPLLEKYRKISEDLSAHFTDEATNEVYEPPVGSLVAAQLPTDGAWYRAYILSKVENSYRVAFCDMGFSQKVEKIRKLREELCEIQQFAIRCRVTDYVLPRNDVWGLFLKVGQNVKLTFDDVSPQKATARIIDEDVVCVVEMTKWKPIPEDKGLQTIKLQNNSSVILTSFSSPRTMFLKPSDTNLQESFNRILQDVAGHAFKAPPMDRLPIKGEIVACKYNRDENYYRAKVMGFIKDKVLVTYLDFGNTEEEDPSSFKELTEELKNVPPSVVRVQLKDVPDLPLNIQVAEYLSEINLKEQELKVKFVNIRDGVDLYLDGTHINAKIKSFLEPTWQQPKVEDKDDTPDFLYENLRFVDLPVGEVISMLICFSQPPNIVFGFKEGSEDMAYIMNEMESKINEYCSKVEKNTFLPRKSEMCLAEYEGSWYRASCLEIINSEEVSVFFIDYGNIEKVSFKNIRKMPLDFMQTRVAVVSCTVMGITQDDAGKEDHVTQFVNCVKKVKVLKNVAKGHFEIEIVE